VPRERKKTGSTLLDAARKHQEALQAAGLSASAVERYEAALRGLDFRRKPLAGTAQVLVRDVQREVEEFQAAIRKEFPGNPSFHALFRAQEPMPSGPREVLALGRQVARNAPEYAQNLIKYALNAATVKHLVALCDQLAAELGAADLPEEARALEEEIRGVARRAFAGRPELAAFEAK